jgi:periplasmic protein TonB
MFTTLVESRSMRARSTKSTMMSVVLHGGVIAAAVAATMPGSVDARPEPMPRDTLIYVTTHRPPPPPSAPIHARPQPDAPSAPLPNIPMPTITPTSIPPVDVSAPELPAEIIIGREPHTPGSPFGSGPVSSDTPGSVVNLDAVERIPRVLGNAPRPLYPSALRASGMAGNVVVRFVVDTLGRAEMDGFTVVETSHVLFTDAVKNALALYRFSPGEVGGRKVRTMVQVPFTFSLTH